jgi:hypothetical protein
MSPPSAWAVPVSRPRDRDADRLEVGGERLRLGLAGPLGGAQHHHGAGHHHRLVDEAAIGQPGERRDQDQLDANGFEQGGEALMLPDQQLRVRWPPSGAAEVAVR